MADNVIILEPGEERAQKIARAMGSPMAGDILRLLAENEKSLSDISEQLEIPLTTAKYHIENLLDAGLVSVMETKYSAKGREVKIYSLTDQLLIVAPRQSDVRSLLLRYAALFGVVALGSVAISLIIPLLGSPAATGFAPAPMIAQREAGGGAVMATKLANDMAAASPASVPDPVLSFFLGGVMVIIVLLVYEAYAWKKRY